MPDKILSKDQLSQLDGNIRKMVGDGLGREDIDAYARDFKEKFGKSDGSSVSNATAAPVTAIVQPAAPVSKYQKAVNDDRSNVGKLAATVYNGFVGAFESLAGFGVEAFNELATRIPTPQYDIGGNKLGTTLYDLKPEQQKQARKELKKSVSKGFDVLKSEYVTKQEEKQLQGKFDVTNGIGLDDMTGLVAMSGRIAGDIGLAAATGGYNYFMQAYSDGVDDYDETIEKMGIKENPNARAFYGTTLGTINGLLEKFAIGKIVGDGPMFKNIQKKVLANVLKNTSKMTGKAAIDAIESAAIQEIKALTSGIKQVGLKTAYRTLVESGTEGLQSGLEDGAKFATNWAQGVDVFNEKEIKDNFRSKLLNSAAAGGVFGPVIGFGMDKTFGQNVNTQVLKDIAEANTPEQLAAINDELAATFDENNFTQEERDAVMANANRYAQIKQTLPAGTNAIAQTIAIPLIENRIKLDNEIQSRRTAMETIDEALKPDEEFTISVLEDKRAQINDDIKEVVNNEKFEYYEDNGKYYKKLGENTPEEISKNRFELQQLKTEEAAPVTQSVESLRAQEEQELLEAIPNINDFKVNGKVDRNKITDPAQRSKFDEIYDKYDKLITPLLPQANKAEPKAQQETGYSFIVGEEGSDFPVTALVNKKVKKDGRPAILYQEGQRIVARILGTNRIEDVGNVVEMMDALPQDFGIEVDETVVTETPTGYRVEGEDMVNDSENPLDAISVDQNGNVMNVVLKTPAGKRRKFRGQAAKDLAYQITLKETLKNEDEFELFLEQEHQAELDAAEAKAAAEAASTGANEPVPTTEGPTTTEPVTGPTVTTEPTYGRFTIDNINDVDKIKGFNKLQKKVLRDVKSVVNAIVKIVKAQGNQLSVNLHDQDSFEKAVIEAGGSKEDSTSRGFYMAGDGSIHLNMDNLASDTMLHEGFHPILDFMESNYPEIINDFFAELETIPGSEDIIAQARDNYDGDVTQKKEAITDFVAGVADGRILLNPSNFRKIRKFLLDMLNKIGIGNGGGKIMEAKDTKGLIRLAEFVTEVFTEKNATISKLGGIEFPDLTSGEQVTFDGIETIVGDDTADPVTVSNIAVVDPIQFAKVKTNKKAYKPVDVKWVSKGLSLIVPKVKSSLYNIVSKSGGAIVVTNSDATGVGMKKGVLRQGGIGYTFIKQNVDDKIGFAASMDSKQTAFFKAVQEAAKIRDEKFPEMKGKPVAVFVMVQAPEVMFGNAYGAEYFIKAISSALSSNEISIADAKSNIINYFNSIKESNATGEKYANSIDALIQLIQNTNPKSANDKNKIYELLITNRENKKDKSAKFGFDARRVLFGQFFNKVGPAKNKPGGKIRDLLGKNGFNHRDFYDMYGDENVINTLEGKTEAAKLADGGFIMTGFFVDPTMSEKEYVKMSRAGTFQHKQFNGRFAGTEPFVLDGKYYVNEVFPEARFIDKNGKPVPVTTATAGSMYPRTKTEPQAIVERAKAISESKFQSQKAQIGVEKQSGTTQRSITTKSYIKAANIAQKLGAKSVLDYGAGLGLGSDAIRSIIGSVESLEPNSENWQGNSPVTYNKSEDISKKYDAVINLNVLNVVRKNMRDAIVLDIFDKLNVGGNAIISTRKWNDDVNRAKNFIKGPEEKSNIVKKKSGGKEVDVYQKGFDGNELVDYVKSLLGTSATVTKDNSFGAAGVVINKKSELPSTQFQKAPTKAITKGKLGGVKKTFKEQVRYGLLGKENVRLKEKMSGELSAELATAETRVQETMKTIKKYAGAVTEKDISNFMEGKTSASQLPLDLATQLTEMRAQIDGLTERLIQLGVIDSQESIDYYRENKGKYLLRSYEAINFKENPLIASFTGKGLNIDNVVKKLKNVDRTVVNNALRYLSDRAKAKYIIQNVLQQNTVKVVDFDKDNYSLVLTSNGQEIAKIPKDSGDTKNKAAVNFMSTYLIDPANIQSYNDIKSTIPNVQLSDDAALKEARKDANEILSNSEDYVMNKGMTGSTNVKSLRQRKDISPEIRALMGEYSDPLYNYYATVFKVASLTSSRQYLNSLKNFGMGNFFFTEKTEEATVKFAGDESDALAPLNGIYTFPEIKEALKVAEKETTLLITQIAGRVRMLKTVYNPATHVKNIIGNMGFAVSNGHWTYLPEAYKYTRSAITGKKDADIMAMMDTLNRYGVLNNVIGVGELKAYFDQNESVDDFLKSIYNNANGSTTASKLGKVKANLGKIPKAIEKAYAIEDDVFKILAFVNESNRYSKALFGKDYKSLSSDQKQEIDNIASEIVKDTYPTFSRVPKGVRTLSKFAFLGNFLAFPVESVRTQYNSLSLGMKEVKSGNPKLKSVGYTRLGGALAYNAIFSTMAVYAYNLAGAGLTGAVGMLFGDDEEENETSNAIKKNLAPWNKNSEVYVSQFKDGILKYTDIGSLDSYGYQRRVWNAFFSTKNKGEFDQMMASGIGELLDPWMTKDFVVDNYMKLSTNDNGRGGFIFNPEGKAMDKFTDMSLYAGKQFGPGAVGAAIKIADSYQKGEYDKVMDELGAQVFARQYTVDLHKQFQNYIYTEATNPKQEVGFKGRLANAEKLYTDAKRQKLSPLELSQKYTEALDAYKEVLLTANGYYKAAALGGTNPRLLIESLKRSRIGRPERIAIITGSFGKFDQAYIRK